MAAHRLSGAIAGPAYVYTQTPRPVSDGRGVVKTIRLFQRGQFRKQVFLFARKRTGHVNSQRYV